MFLFWWKFDHVLSQKLVKCWLTNIWHCPNCPSCSFKSWIVSVEHILNVIDWCAKILIMIANKYTQIVDYIPCAMVILLHSVSCVVDNGPLTTILAGPIILEMKYYNFDEKVAIMHALLNYCIFLQLTKFANDTIITAKGSFSADNYSMEAKNGGHS